jgi:hypothetical protein
MRPERLRIKGSQPIRLGYSQRINHCGAPIEDRIADIKQGHLDDHLEYLLGSH